MQHSLFYNQVNIAMPFIPNVNPFISLCTIQVNVEALNVEVGQNDVIGWTLNREEGVMSISYIETAQTLFRNLEPGPPVVGQDYVYDQIPLPAEFSMAARVNPSK